MNISICEDQQTWNSALVALGGSLYHSWEWGETRLAIGRRPWRVLAQKNGIPVAAMQIFERRITGLNAALMYAARGIAGNDLDPEVVAALADWSRGFAKKRKAIVLRLETHFEDSDEAQKKLLRESGFKALPDQWSLWNLPRANMVIDIRGTEEELLRRMRKKHREHIHRAQRSGLKMVSTSEVADLQAFYDLLLKSSERQGFAVRDFNYFVRLREQLLTNERGSLFLGSIDGKPVAGILCAHFGSTCHYLYGGFDWSARQAYANEALHWTAIQWARKAGCSYYDMVSAGTAYPPVEGNPGYGLYNFKKGFGAELIFYAGYFDQVIRPALYSALRLAETHTGWVMAARGARAAVQKILRPSRASKAVLQASPVFRGNAAREGESAQDAEFK